MFFENRIRRPTEKDGFFKFFVPTNKPDVSDVYNVISVVDDHYIIFT